MIGAGNPLYDRLTFGITAVSIVITYHATFIKGCHEFVLVLVMDSPLGKIPGGSIPVCPLAFKAFI
jgi:hypothetical protein